MPFNGYRSQDIDPTPLPLVLADLRSPGGKPSPCVHVVSTANNTGWIESLLDDADDDGPAKVGDGEVKYDPKREAAVEKRLRERLARHVVKKLENVYHDDGRIADGPTDIMEFMTSIPKFIVLRILAWV